MAWRAALLGFDWDAYEEDHASGNWIGGTYRATPDSYWHFLVPDDLIVSRSPEGPTRFGGEPEQILIRWTAQTDVRL